MRRLRSMRASLAFLGLILVGCQKTHISSDPYAGLPQAILAWRGDIAETAACNAKPTDGGKGCQGFTVGCKVEQPLGTPDIGVSAKVLVAMSWDAWNPVTAGYEPASSGAAFAKTNGRWVRHDLNGPINLGTCATS